VSPRVGRIGLPPDAPRKAVDVDCGPYFDANRAAFAALRHPAHVWYFHDPVFLDDVFRTIRGDVDRLEIATRVNLGGRLSLRRAV